LFGVKDERPGKASLDLKKPVIMANSSKTGEKTLQSGISEYNSHPDICNAVPSGLRKICVTSGLTFLLLMAITLKYLPSSRLAQTYVCSVRLTSTALNIRLRILASPDDA
jgi:hypothetical protein